MKAEIDMQSLTNHISLYETLHPYTALIETSKW